MLNEPGGLAPLGISKATAESMVRFPPSDTPTEGKTMTNHLRRIITSLAVSAGLVATTSIPASAGVLLGNHCRTLINNA